MSRPVFPLIEQEEMLQGLLARSLLRHLRLQLMQAPGYLTKLDCTIVVLVKEVEQSVHGRALHRVYKLHRCCQVLQRGTIVDR